MQHSRFWTILTLGLGSFSLFFGVLNPAQSQPPRIQRFTKYQQWRDIDDLLTQIRKDNKTPAISVAIVQNGKVAEERVNGLREQGKTGSVQTNDRWQIGSIGKSMTSTLIAILIEKGVLRWDMTLGEALPKLRMQHGYERVTLEQVMQHRGGIPQDMGYQREFIERITKGAETPTAVRAAYVADILQRAPIAAPGAKMHYSNGGYALLGYIAETRTGKPFEKLMQDTLFKPLGMQHSLIGFSGGAGQPQGHALTENGLEVMNFEGKLPMMTAPAGGACCSIGDLARFAKCHLDGLQGKSTLLKQESFRRLHTPPTTQEGEEKYACGWMIIDKAPVPFHEHNGSNGTFRADMRIYPSKNIAIVAIQNCGGEDEPAPTVQAILAIQRRLFSK